MIDPRLVQAILRIELLVRRDPGGRGLAPFAETHELLPAAADLCSGRRVLIVTGFCIHASMVGETDGPPGSLALACTLKRLGVNVALATDRFSAGLLRAGMLALGESFPIHRLDLPQARADAEIDALLAGFCPTHVVAIERPGRALDGSRYSMRGERLDDIVPATDRLLFPPGPRGWRTLAIGDGGNELGFGQLRERLKERIPLGELIFCATPADYAIPAGISNWGAHALAAALAVLSGSALPAAAAAVADEKTVLEAMIAAGAVDGCTKKCELSVDGIAWGEYSETLADIYREALF